MRDWTQQARGLAGSRLNLRASESLGWECVTEGPPLGSEGKGYRKAGGRAIMTHEGTATSRAREPPLCPAEKEAEPEDHLVGHKGPLGHPLFLLPIFSPFALISPQSNEGLGCFYPTFWSQET